MTIGISAFFRPQVLHTMCLPREVRLILLRTRGNPYRAPSRCRVPSGVTLAPAPMDHRTRCGRIRVRHQATEQRLGSALVPVPVPAPQNRHRRPGLVLGLHEAAPTQSLSWEGMMSRVVRETRRRRGSRRCQLSSGTSGSGEEHWHAHTSCTPVCLEVATYFIKALTTSSHAVSITSTHNTTCVVYFSFLFVSLHSRVERRALR